MRTRRHFRRLAVPRRLKCARTMHTRTYTTERSIDANTRPRTGFEYRSIFRLGSEQPILYRSQRRTSGFARALAKLRRLWKLIAQCTYTCSSIGGTPLDRLQFVRRRPAGPATVATRCGLLCAKKPLKSRVESTPWRSPQALCAHNQSAQITDRCRQCNVSAVTPSPPINTVVRRLCD